MTRERSRSAARSSRAALARSRSAARFSARAARSRSCASRSASARTDASFARFACAMFPRNEGASTRVCVGPPARTFAKISAFVRTRRVSRARASSAWRSYGERSLDARWPHGRGARDASPCHPAPSPSAPPTPRPIGFVVGFSNISTTSSSSSPRASPTSGSSSSGGYPANPPRSPFHASRGSDRKPPEDANEGAAARVAKRSRIERR